MYLKNQISMISKSILKSGLVIIFAVLFTNRILAQDSVIISDKVTERNEEGLIIVQKGGIQAVAQWNRIICLKVYRDYQVLKEMADGAGKGAVIGVGAGLITKESVKRTLPLGAVLGVILKLLKIRGDKFMGWDETVIYDKNGQGNQELLRHYPYEGKKVELIMAIQNGGEIK